MHDSASSGYQRQASTYADIRPSYHPQLVRRFVERWAGDAVVEIGAGTGIFTRQLIELGCQPIAVEPVDAMRAELIARSPDIDARSEPISLPSSGAASSSFNTK